MLKALARQTTVYPNPPKSGFRYTKRRRQRPSQPALKRVTPGFGLRRRILS